VNHRRAAVGAALLTMTATACAGPSGTTDDFRHKVSRTVATFASDVQTAILTSQLVLDHRMTLAYAATTVSQVEDDASSAENTLDSRQPPTTAAHNLLERADQVLQPAMSAISDTRIALRAHNAGQLPTLLEQLTSARKQLEKLYRDVS
jgi:hypothetical protein